MIIIMMVYIVRPIQISGPTKKCKNFFCKSFKMRRKVKT